MSPFPREILWYIPEPEICKLTDNVSVRSEMKVDHPNPLELPIDTVYFRPPFFLAGHYL